MPANTSGSAEAAATSGSRPVITRFSKRRQKGDLTKLINATDKTGEVAALSNGVNSLIDALSAIIHTIRTTASDVQVGLEEMSEGNSNLSQRRAA